jgi:hypothetical protein
MKLTARFLQKADTESDVAELMAKRSFSEEKRETEYGTGWIIYSRKTEYPGEGIWLKVFLKDGKVAKTDMFDEEPENVVATKLGWDGLRSFTNTFGD